MSGLRGTTRAEPGQGYDAQAAEWRAKRNHSADLATSHIARSDEDAQSVYGG